MAIDISSHSASHNVPTSGERDFCVPDYSQINKKYFSSIGTPGKRKRNLAFNSPSSHYNQSNGIHEEKIDNLCCLVEKLNGRNYPPSKKFSTSGDDMIDDTTMSSNENKQNDSKKEIIFKNGNKIFCVSNFLCSYFKGFLMGNDGDSFFLNVQSLRSHHDQLKVLVASLNRPPLVIALCETWLSDNDPLDLYHLDGYQKGIFVNRQNSRGSGFFYFKKNQFFS